MTEDTTAIYITKGESRAKFVFLESNGLLLLRSYNWIHKIITREEMNDYSGGKGCKVLERWRFSDLLHYPGYYTLDKSLKIETQEIRKSEDIFRFYSSTLLVLLKLALPIIIIIFSLWK